MESSCNATGIEGGGTTPITRKDSECDTLQSTFQNHNKKGRKHARVEFYSLSGNSHWNNSGFSNRTFQVRKKGKGIFQILKEQPKKLPTENTLSNEVIILNGGKTTREANIEGIHHYQSNFTEDSERENYIHRETKTDNHHHGNRWKYKNQQEKVKDIQIKQRNLNMWRIRHHSLITTLNLNYLNSPIKETDWLNGSKINKMRFQWYAVY